MKGTRPWTAALLAGVLLPTIASGAPPAPDHSVVTYTFGVVPQFDARQVDSIWKPILEAVEQSSGVRLQLVAAPSIPEFERVLAAGGYDFAYMNPYHIIMAHRAQKYVPLVRDRGTTLHGIIVVRKDSDITRIRQLDGQSVVFPAPGAIGASLIPRAELAGKYHIHIQPRYVGSHVSVYLNVALGLAIAGGGIEQTLGEQPAEVRDKLRILYTTQSVAPHPVAIHPRVPPLARDQVTAAFLRLAADARGQELLSRVPIIKMGTASMADYKSLIDLHLETRYVEASPK